MKKRKNKKLMALLFCLIVGMFGTMALAQEPEDNIPTEEENEIQTLWSRSHIDEEGVKHTEISEWDGAENVFPDDFLDYVAGSATSTSYEYLLQQDYVASDDFLFQVGDMSTSASGGGGTVVDEDGSTTTWYVSGKSTLDLNGYTLDVSDVSFVVTGNLTIMDSSGQSGKLIGQITVEGGSVAIQSGTIENLSGYNFVSSGESSIYINGGTVHSDTAVLNAIDEECAATLTLKNGFIVIDDETGELLYDGNAALDINCGIDGVLFSRYFDQDGYWGETSSECEGWYYAVMFMLGDPQHAHFATVYIEETEPSCNEDGNIGYWICDQCGQFVDAELAGHVLSEEEIILPAYGHQNLHHFSAIDPACEEAGNIEYWFCEDCGTYFFDEDLLEEAEAEEVMIDALGHSLILIASQESSCEEDGSIAYFECENCGRMFADEDAEEELFEEDIVLSALGHQLVYVEGVEATTDSDGSASYYYCLECERMYSDEEGMIEITAEDLVISALISDESDINEQENNEMSSGDETENQKNAEENETPVSELSQDDDREFTWDKEDKEEYDEREVENDRLEDEADYIVRYEYIDEYSYVDEYEYENYPDSDEESDEDYPVLQEATMPSESGVVESGTTYRESGDEILGVTETVSSMAWVFIVCAGMSIIGMFANVKQKEVQR